ncbi:MAG: S8 family serine peptidase, partial [Myxococcales bacterium]|nr:S8 family serine peptidase [Myxococcales bacterium]
MKGRADLAAARAVRGWTARGEAVRNALVNHANRSQAPVRAFLSQQNANFKPFWISNVIRAEADPTTIHALEQRADVAAVLPDRTLSIPKPIRSQGFSTQATEWGLESIRAPEAWDAFGTRGEGIVVANIDTGVQYDHPALQAQYRGNTGGSLDHEYNFFDPTGICGSAPCDNAGHGTHTMGTMVGDDGNPGENQIGVAPAAKWIAAKGCEDFGCSLSSLMQSAEWVLAPTDSSGSNPRPDLRPHVVNNSWGGPPGDPFFMDVVDAWVAAGIFPAFSAGNSGPMCGSTGSPGDYPQSYAAGAYDEFGSIAFFSSRGPSFFGGIKPDIAAPGVDVRSSVPGGGYDFYSGTSMASPHVAGTVALMWSASEAIARDIETTRLLLGDGAVPVSDLSCDGSDDSNNVWGRGQLDAYGAVELAPRGPSGSLEGAIVDATTEAPIANATVVASSLETSRSTSTALDGSYALTLPVDSYDVSITAFGYVAAQASGVLIEDGLATALSMALEPAPSYAIGGMVLDGQGAPIAGATVTVEGTPLPPAITDASGSYLLPSVPAGDYGLTASAGRCSSTQQVPVSLSSDMTVDFALQQRTDAFGYSCSEQPYAYVPGESLVASYGDEMSWNVQLPFGFPFYGTTFGSVDISDNGTLVFSGDYVPW